MTECSSTSYIVPWVPCPKIWERRGEREGERDREREGEGEGERDRVEGILFLSSDDLFLFSFDESKTAETQLDVFCVCWNFKFLHD